MGGKGISGNSGVRCQPQSKPIKVNLQQLASKPLPIWLYKMYPKCEIIKICCQNSKWEFLHTNWEWHDICIVSQWLLLLWSIIHLYFTLKVTWLSTIGYDRSMILAQFDLSKNINMILFLSVLLYRSTKMFKQ